MRETDSETLLFFSRLPAHAIYSARSNLENIG